AWNATTRPYPRDRGLHELVAAQATRTPDAIAVQWGAQTLTYGDLVRRAARWARRLRQRGVGPDVVVGLHLERSPTLVVAMLAVLQAGGAYLPLDPAAPPARRAFMLADAHAALALTQGAAADLAPPADLGVAGTPVLDVADLDAEAAGDAAQAAGDAEAAAFAGDAERDAGALPPAPTRPE